MGCFNASCFISNISIKKADAVRGFIVRKNPYADESHHRSPFLPLCPPVTGLYDEYGGINKINKNLSVKMLEKFFKLPISDILIIPSRSGPYDVCNYLPKLWREDPLDFSKVSKLVSMDLKCLTKLGFNITGNIITDPNSQVKLNLTKNPNISNVMLVLEYFYKQTGYFWGYSAEAQSLVKLATELEFLMVHEDIYQSMLFPEAGNLRERERAADFIDNIKTQKNIKKIMKGITYPEKLFLVGSDLKLSSFDLDVAQEMPSLYKILNEKELKISEKEITELLTFSSTMYGTCKNYNVPNHGEQHSDYKESIKLLTVALKLAKKKKQELK